MISRKTSRENGFTFLEIMIVVTIIGILVSIVGVTTGKKITDARIAATRQQMQTVETALETYEMHVGDLPTTEQGLEALVRRPSGVPESEWRQGLKAMPVDGWGTPFRYACPGSDGKEFDLISSGKDRQMGTSDDIVFTYERVPEGAKAN